MKVLVLSSHTKSLLWYRWDMLMDFLKRGHQVYATGDLTEEEWSQFFKKHGITYKSIPVSKNGINPLKDLRTKKYIQRLLSEIVPDKIFVYQAKTIAFGCQAASNEKIKEVYPMVAGLGSIFRGHGFKNSVIKFILGILYKRAFKNSKAVFFQNKDDIQQMVSHGFLQDNKIVMVRGSGVNLEKFKLTHLPNVITFLFVGRIIRDKGVSEYLRASKYIKSKYGSKVKCLLVGPFDTNPSALSLKDLAPFIDSGVEYFGEQMDVIPYLEQCSVFVLPSYHEGTPKSVLEAMAMGRAIITTDAPGCRETVSDGTNGFLVPVGDVESIIDKMEMFINHPDLANTMGLASRKIAEEKFDVRKVNSIILSTMGL